MIRTLLIAASAAALSTAPALAETYAVTGAKLLMTGGAQAPGEIENGTVIIEDGRIAAIGAGIAIPEDAQLIDAAGSVVTPGLFAAMSGIGLEEIGLAGEPNDASARGDIGFSASIDAADGFYADSAVIPVNRAGGVTRAYVAPASGDDLFGGCGMLIVLTGEPDAITERCIAQTVSLGYSGASRIGDSRPAAMSRLRRALDDAAAYARNPRRYGDDYEEGRLSARDAAALAEVLTGEQKMLVSVQGASDIRRVLALGEDYGIDLVLVGAAEAHRVAGEIAEADVPVIMDPLQNLPDRFESFGATLSSAGMLEEAGVLVAFYDADIGYTHNVRNIRQLAGNAVANGMSYDGALAAITQNPALIWEQAGTGRLTPGAIADLVIWDGDPLDVTSLPTAVFIAGERQSMENRQQALAERYKDLSRGDKPIAYRNGE